MKPVTSLSPLRGILLGAYYGLLAWLAYAVLEFALAATSPLRSYQNTIIARWYWDLTLILWALYAGAGIVSGALAGLLTRFAAAPVEDDASGRQVYEAAGTATLILAFTINLGTVASFDFAALACGVLMTAGLIGTLFSQPLRQYAGALRNPWISAGLMLIASRAGASFLSRNVVIRAALPLFVMAAAIVLSAILRLIHLPRPQVLRAAAVAAGMIAVPGGTLYMNRSAAPARPSTAAPAAKPAPVILLSLDTVRADHLSVYGYSRNTTPNLARLAAGSTLYRHAIAAGDMTLPTHAAMFTGTYASWNGAHFDAPAHAEPQPLSKSYRTIAELLSSKGYLTVSVAANFSYFQPEFGLTRGFAVSDSLSPIQFLSFDRDYYLRFGVRKLLDRLHATVDSFDLVTRRASEINDAATRTLERDWDRRRPLFLFLNYMDAHCPYLPPPPYNTMFPGENLHISSHDYYELANDVAAMKRPVSPQQRDSLVSQYDGSIAYLDSQIGVLLQRVKDMGIYDDALIIVTSDHGEMFGERDSLGHGLSVYQGQVDVPLIVKYPRQQAGRVVEEAVGQTDLLPTILEALGDPRPDYLQGRSLTITGPRPSPELVSESFAQPKLMQTHQRYNRVERALISGSLKLIASSAGKRELYDIFQDPAEQHDLCSSQAEACENLYRKLESWHAQAPRAPAQTRKLDPESLKRLKSLGYVMR
jgi:arylsulfatase A-like enzyme